MKKFKTLTVNNGILEATLNNLSNDGYEVVFFNSNLDLSKFHIVAEQKGQNNEDNEKDCDCCYSCGNYGYNGGLRPARNRKE